ncbi:hypothetical protein E4U47_001592 [Claviceps purpurea]|nr:hypothetical protein E4U38_000578 [Claviceps purpurea]KAG6274193.1 hypothetical protein E4U47_001592 [Claviceps purpurea]
MIRYETFLTVWIIAVKTTTALKYRQPAGIALPRAEANKEAIASRFRIYRSPLEFSPHHMPVRHG